MNQYTSIDSNSLTYDLNGNLKTHNGWDFSYDFENRLTSAVNGTTSASYQCDAFNRRISKTVNETTTNFVWDGNNLLAEYDSSGNLLRKYIHSDKIDEPIAMAAGSNRYFYHADALGSITEITDNTGTIKEKYSYDSYGKTTIKDASSNVLIESAIENRFGFTGRELDTETGLYNYRNRYYSPSLGRFLQEDPVGHIADINLYRYVSNNPINWIDPFGFDKEEKRNPKDDLDDFIKKKIADDYFRQEAQKTEKANDPSPEEPVAQKEKSREEAMDDAAKMGDFVLDALGNALSDDNASDLFPAVDYIGKPSIGDVIREKSKQRQKEKRDKDIKKDIENEKIRRKFERGSLDQSSPHV